MKHYRLLVFAGLLGLLGVFPPATAAAQSSINWGKLMPAVPQSPPPFTITTQVTINDAPSTLEGVEVACAVCQGATCPATTIDREPLWGRTRAPIDPIAEGLRENRTLSVDVEVYNVFCASTPCMSPTKSGTYDAFLSAQRTYGCVVSAVGRDPGGSRRVAPFATAITVSTPSFAKTRAGSPLTLTLTGAIQ